MKTLNADLKLKVTVYLFEISHFGCTFNSMQMASSTKNKATASSFLSKDFQCVAVKDTMQAQNFLVGGEEFQFINVILAKLENNTGT